jgi:hypothetical protein
MRTLLAGLAALSTCLAASAQDATDIFLADLRLEQDAIVLGTPARLTDRAGYDNQPWFLPDGSALLYVSDAAGSMDVFRHDIESGRSVQLTRTPQHEFSPSLPGDGTRMLVVRWEADMSDGALWWYSADGEPLAEATGSVPRVGYYAFADAGTLALFINDDVQSFVLADARTGETARIGEGMGGSAPRPIAGRPGSVSFLRQHSDGSWWLSRLDTASREVTALVRMLDGVVHYSWTADGSVLAASGATLHRWRPGSDGWQAVASFDDPSLQSISRIALSPAGDRIALVAARAR